MLSDRHSQLYCTTYLNMKKYENLGKLVLTKGIPLAILKTAMCKEGNF